MMKNLNSCMIRGITNPGWILTIVSTLFPQAERLHVEEVNKLKIKDSELFTLEEIKKHFGCFKSESSRPGWNSQIININSMRETFNCCLKMENFPISF